MDSSALIIAVVGYTIVFIALVILWLIFANMPRLFIVFRKWKYKLENKEHDCDKCDEFISGQENAAIAVALYLYFNELHDDESTKMTIKKVKRDYSPWSSRVYTINSFQRNNR